MLDYNLKKRTRFAETQNLIFFSDFFFVCGKEFQFLICKIEIGLYFRQWVIVIMSSNVVSTTSTTLTLATTTTVKCFQYNVLP